MAANSGTVLFSPMNWQVAGEGPTIIEEHFILGNLPILLMGDGTPDGDREPFLSAPKGSLYIQGDASDDAVALFIKVDEDGADNDWNSASMT